MSMTRLILTDDAFHGGEPLPRVVRIDAHAPPSGGLYSFIPCVASPAVPRQERDAPAGEAPPIPISPAGISSKPT